MPSSLNFSSCEPIFDFTPEAIAAHAAETIATLVRINDEVASVPLDQVTFENVAQPLIDVESYSSARASNLVVMLHVSPHEQIRGACGMALQQVMATAAEQGMRTDTFAALKQLASNTEALANCSSEHKRFVERSVLAGERSGLQLDDATRGQLSELQAKISQLETQFGQNIAEESIELVFSAEELEGMSADFLARLGKDDGSDRYKVVLSYPTAYPIMTMCSVPATREKVELVFTGRCIDSNIKVLEELVALRHERAAVLGYKNHATFVLEQCMAKSPERVSEFLNELNEKLTPLANKEMAALLALKQEDCETRGLPFDGKINMWDFRYYMDRYVKKHCSIDSEKVREFFPLDHVTKELLAMYQELLSLKFVEIPEPYVWHEDVRKFAVYDARPDREDRLLGHFYMDLFPRPGKFTHAGCMGLKPSSVDASGERMLPAVALLTNFTKPTDSRPCLLSHGQVETFFHEFGHIMHSMCSEAVTGMFSGTNVEKDFVETPSQMLENWCWETAPLQRLSSHYVTQEPLSEEFISRLQSTRYVNNALRTKQQLMEAQFDQLIHSGPTVNTTAHLTKLHDETLRITMTPGTNLAASFGHLANGYDAQYYGYLWSKVFPMDMFQSRFKAEGLMNPKTGLSYRETILARGGSVDATEMLKEFLGREPTQTAYLKSNGLDTAE